MVNVYDFHDYRELLAALYAERKAANKAFSYRLIASKAGFSSPSFFGKVVKGESNISPSMTLRLSEVFKLRRHESEFFELLVLYGQAKDPKDKKQYWDRMSALRRATIKTLETGKYAVFSEWYILAVRALLDYYLFRGDYAELAGLLVPRITPRQAKLAVDTLLAHGLVRPHPDGHMEVVDAVLSTGDAWESAVIENYQKAMLELARECYNRSRNEQRDLSTLTLSLSEASFKLVRERLALARRDIMEIAKNEQRADRVCQVNIQAFPVTRTGSRP